MIQAFMRLWRQPSKFQYIHTLFLAYQAEKLMGPLNMKAARAAHAAMLALHRR